MGSMDCNCFDEVLGRCLEILAPLKPLLPSWHERISAFRDTGAYSSLRVGVVGVTSSGKSTFINGLLGEQILPEQSKATTNIPVICRWGEHRTLKVIFANAPSETFVHTEVTPEVVKSFSTEDDNPENVKRVLRIELDLPSCTLNRGLEIIDTPGTDAFGLDNHGEITIQKCIPISDIVVFMTQVRQGGLHKCDVDLLENVIEGNQHVLFIVSNSDIEEPNTEGGRVMRSRETKLANIVQAFELSLRNYPKLRRSSIIPVSSLWARQARGDRASDLWRASNFEAVLTALDKCVEESNKCLLDERMRRARLYIESLALALPSKANVLLDRSESTSEEQNLENRVRLLRRARNNIGRNISQVIRAASVDVNLESVTSDALATIATASRSDVDGVYHAGARAEHKWYALTQSHLTQLQELRQACRESLKGLALAPSRNKLQDRVLKLEPFPGVSEHVVREIETYEIQRPRSGIIGRLRDWWSGVRVETRTRTTKYVDIASFKRHLKDYFSAACVAFHEFMQEQSAVFSDIYLGPVEGQLEEANRSLKDLRFIRKLAAEQLKCLPGIVRQLGDLLDEAGPSPDRLAATLPDTVHGPIVAAVPEAPSGPLRRPGNAALRMFLDTVWESIAIRRFWQVVGRASSGRKIESLLWVGGMATRFDDLVCFLTRTARASLPPTNAEATTMAYVGWDSLGSIEFCCSSGDAASTLERFGEACIRASVIIVDFNAIQPSSSLNRLLRDPRHAELIKSTDKIMFVSLDGAAFDSHIADLPNEVIPMVAKHSKFGSRPWFICEPTRRDARYTDYVEFHDTTSAVNGSSRDLIRLWREARVPISFPFTRHVLEASFTVKFSEGQ